jgi:hypothetical protein
VAHLIACGQTRGAELFSNDPFSDLSGWVLDERFRIQRSGACCAAVVLPERIQHWTDEVLRPCVLLA